MGWNGEKFTIRPMKLYRINTNSFEASLNIKTVELQIRDYQAVHSIPLTVEPITNNFDIVKVFPEIVNEEFNSNLTELEEKVTQLTESLSDRVHRKINETQQHQKKMKARMDENVAKLLNEKNEVFTRKAGEGSFPIGDYYIFADPYFNAEYDESTACPSEEFALEKVYLEVKTTDELAEDLHPGDFGHIKMSVGGNPSTYKIIFHICRKEEIVYENNLYNEYA